MTERFVDEVGEEMREMKNGEIEEIENKKWKRRNKGGHERRLISENSHNDKQYRKTKRVKQTKA